MSRVLVKVQWHAGNVATEIIQIAIAKVIVQNFVVCKVEAKRLQILLPWRVDLKSEIAFQSRTTNELSTSARN